VKNKRHRTPAPRRLAARFAQEQGKFWAFHDLAYKNQHQLGAANLRPVRPAGRPRLGEVRGLRLGRSALRGDPRRLGTRRRMAVHGTRGSTFNGTSLPRRLGAEAVARALEEALGRARPTRRRRRSRSTSRPRCPDSRRRPSTRALSFGALKFSIDTFEAGLQNGAASSAAPDPRHPHELVRRSRRLHRGRQAPLHRAEWVSACSGNRRHRRQRERAVRRRHDRRDAYPYGDYRRGRSLLDDKQGDAVSPVYTGELPGCVGPAGVYDLTGNLEEWSANLPRRRC